MSLWIRGGTAENRHFWLVDTQPAMLVMLLAFALLSPHSYPEPILWLSCIVLIAGILCYMTAKICFSRRGFQISITPAWGVGDLTGGNAVIHRAGLALMGSGFVLMLLAWLLRSLQ